MNFNLQQFLSDLGKAPLRAKLTVVASVLALVGILSLAGMVATRPHFVTIFSGLDDTARVAVEKALAEGGVRFRASQPPGPYAVYVDESQIDEAHMAVALAEALTLRQEGISTGANGATSIFMSSGERQQTMLKREWEETEHQLEQLNFIERATVRTSIPDSSPMSHERRPATVAVTLQVRGGAMLSNAEAKTVAKLVLYRWDVPPENVLVSDQSGRTLFDASASGDEGSQVRDLVENSARYDRDLAKKVNDSLLSVFGPHKTLVTVTSDWNFDQQLVVDDRIDPETVQLSSEKRESKTPQGGSSGVGGPAGVASNLANPDQEQDGFAPVSKPIEATESDEKAVFDASRTRSQTVTTAPRLARLSVSLMIDESLSAKRDEIVEIVKAAVGFDPDRKDFIGVSTTLFASEELVLDDSGNPVPATGEAPAEESGGTMEVLMTRGVEIVAALGFVVMLLLSLKAPKSAPAPGTTQNADGEAVPGLDEPDPSLLARAQIEELVKSDPRRVGEILSAWAREGGKVKA